MSFHLPRLLSVPYSFFALFLCVFSQAGVSQGPPPMSLEIRLDKPSHKVSPMLYGLMTEEINFSYDGGLYAEMVRNRTFSERSHAQPTHWYLVENGNAEARMQLDDHNGPSEALQSSLLLEVMKADAHAEAGSTTRATGAWPVTARTRHTTAPFTRKPMRAK